MFISKEKQFDKYLNKWFNRWDFKVPAERGEIKSNAGENAKETLELFATMSKACVEDFSKEYEVNLDYSFDSVQLLDNLITPKFRKKYEKLSDPNDFNNLMLVVTCEMSTYIGEVIIRRFGGKWVPMIPYWNSPIKFSNGDAVLPFNWVMKAMSIENNQKKLYVKMLGLEEQRNK